MAGDPDANSPFQAVEATKIKGAWFQIKKKVPVVTLSINGNTRFLENIK